MRLGVSTPGTGLGYPLQAGLSSSPTPKLKRPRNGTHQVSLGFSKLSQHDLGYGTCLPQHPG